MKIKLLRDTMITGTPTSAGTIVEVEDHIGFMLLNIHKAEKVKVVETKVDKQPNFDRMTKLELESFGSDQCLDLDLSKTKKQLITELQTALSIT